MFIISENIIHIQAFIQKRKYILHILLPVFHIVYFAPYTPDVEEYFYTYITTYFHVMLL